MMMRLLLNFAKLKNILASRDENSSNYLEYKKLIQNYNNQDGIAKSKYYNMIMLCYTSFVDKFITMSDRFRDILSNNDIISRLNQKTNIPFKINDLKTVRQYLLDKNINPCFLYFLMSGYYKNTTLYLDKSDSLEVIYIKKLLSYIQKNANDINEISKNYSIFVYFVQYLFNNDIKKFCAKNNYCEKQKNIQINKDTYISIDKLKNSHSENLKNINNILTILEYIIRYVKNNNASCITNYVK